MRHPKSGPEEDAEEDAHRGKFKSLDSFLAHASDPRLGTAHPAATAEKGLPERPVRRLQSVESSPDVSRFVRQLPKSVQEKKKKGRDHLEDTTVSKDVSPPEISDLSPVAKHIDAILVPAGPQHPHTQVPILFGQASDDSSADDSSDDCIHPQPQLSFDHELQYQQDLDDSASDAEYYHREGVLNACKSAASHHVAHPEPHHPDTSSDYMSFEEVDHHSSAGEETASEEEPSPSLSETEEIECVPHPRVAAPIRETSSLLSPQSSDGQVERYHSTHNSTPLPLVQSAEATPLSANHVLPGTRVDDIAQASQPAVQTRSVSTAPDAVPKTSETTVEGTVHSPLSHHATSTRMSLTSENNSLTSANADRLDSPSDEQATPKVPFTLQRGRRGKSSVRVHHPDSKSLVAKRVDDYESFLALTEAEINASIKLPLPTVTAGVAANFASSKTASPPSLERSFTVERRSKRLTNESLVLSSCTTKSAGSQGPISFASGAESLFRADGDGGEAQEFDRCNTMEMQSPVRLRMQQCDSSKVTVSEGLPPSSKPANPTQFDVFDAPPAAESLQELIPEYVPRVQPDFAMAPQEDFGDKVRSPDPNLFPECPLEEMPEISLEDDTIVRVESMEKLPSFSLSRQGSLASLQTETYSSPTSPDQSAASQAGFRAQRHDKWRASDHDLFAEDPMTESSTNTGNLYGQADTRRRMEKRITENDLGSVIDSAYFENSLVDDFDSSNMIASMPREGSRRDAPSDSEEGEEHIATPFATLGDRSSWQRRSEELDFVQPAGLPNREIDNKSEKLVRKTTTESTALSTSTLSDRERTKGGEGSLIGRILHSPMSSHVYLSPVAGQPLPSSKVGRSMSASDSQYNNWPEYQPSIGDSALVSPRHRSDVATGTTARQRDLLPFEVLHAHTLNDDYMERDFPIRFRGPRRAWSRIFRRSTASREANDVRGAVRSILRLGRRPLITDEELDAVDRGLDSTYRHANEKPSRRSGTVTSDYMFDIDIEQDAVFTLLNRLCLESGFNVTVRRPNYKMKVQVPCEGTRVPLLVSIQILKSSLGRGTCVSMVRSRDDQSGGPVTDIEAAGVLLRKRLGSHVEFIEDSFSELYMRDSEKQFGTPAYE
ncbi:unnamed protein product [Chondrus crispus]|uniref:Uncharacterized protein n=1 Tax=Chondrus crispus TaxID=2769 RepID=R7Q449_CHOCR|nr:unnamed protein product [Chondrus crispus]CDF32116.1 unnamed protein product [Chondrus crispus]|eukprot:XP_005711781.1 unnamed protein product [Chondrus crispus]